MQIHAAIREYAFQTIARELWPVCSRPGPLENVAPSFLSGAAMGGVAAGIMRRPIFPGMLTFAGLCTGAQLTVNGIRAGAQYVVRKCGWEEPAPVVAAPASGTGAEVKQPVDASPEVPQKSSIWSRACTWLAENSPIQPLSDSEYKERLQRRGAELDAELVLLERELAHYRQALQDSKS